MFLFTEIILTPLIWKPGLAYTLNHETMRGFNNSATFNINFILYYENEL